MTDRRNHHIGFRTATPYLFILPALIAMMLIVLVPAVVGILLSFTDFSIKNMMDFGQVNFVGLENYIYLFGSGSGLSNNFQNSIIASLKLVVSNVICVYTLGMTAALALNKEGKFFRILRAVFLIPWIIPSVVTTFMFKSFLMHDSGGLNDLLQRLHLISKPIYWLAGDKSIVSVIIVSVWRGWPFIYISLLAGLQGIPQDMYDAAKVDGASHMKTFTYITFPMLFPVSRILLLLQIIWSALDFNTTFVLYNMVPPKQANVLPLLAYNTSFTQWDFSRGATVATLLMVTMMIISMIYIRLVVEKEKY